MTQRTAGALMVMTSAAGFATLAIFIKYAYAAGVNTVTMLTARFLIAAVVLWIVIKLRGISASVDKKGAIKLLLMGILGYGTMSLLFAYALHYLPASLTAMLLYTYPALVSLMAFALGDERFSLQKGIALAICFIGLFLVLGVSFTGLNPLGIVLGLGSALVYSCYIVAGNRILKKIDSIVATAYVCSSCGIGLLLAGAAGGMISLSFEPQGWLAILGIAFLGTIVGVLGFFAGMSRIGAANASIISTLEPLITVILSALLLGEVIAPLQAIGGGLILAGVIILQLWANDIDTASETALIAASPNDSK